jgi:hypothetical protein
MQDLIQDLQKGKEDKEKYEKELREIRKCNLINKKRRL